MHTHARQGRGFERARLGLAREEAPLRIAGETTVQPLHLAITGQQQCVFHHAAVLTDSACGSALSASFVMEACSASAIRL